MKTVYFFIVFCLAQVDPSALSQQPRLRGNNSPINANLLPPQHFPGLFKKCDSKKN